MNLTFLNVVHDYNKKLSYSVNLFSLTLVWTEDYEKAWYLIYDEIPEAVNYFWVNRFGTYLYKFERKGKEWEMVEKGEALTKEGLKRIRTGKAFDHHPQLLEEHEIISWILT